MFYCIFVCTSPATGIIGFQGRLRNDLSACRERRWTLLTDSSTFNGRGTKSEITLHRLGAPLSQCSIVPWTSGVAFATD